MNSDNTQNQVQATEDIDDINAFNAFIDQLEIDMEIYSEFG